MKLNKNTFRIFLIKIFTQIFLSQNDSSSIAATPLRPPVKKFGVSVATTACVLGGGSKPCYCRCNIGGSELCPLS